MFENQPEGAPNMEMLEVELDRKLREDKEGVLKSTMCGQIDAYMANIKTAMNATNSSPDQFKIYEALADALPLAKEVIEAVWFRYHQLRPEKFQGMR